MNTRSELFDHRAIAPILANLLLIALVAVGGTIAAVFAQAAFNTEQVSGFPTLELIRIIGYDARDDRPLKIHNGNFMSVGMSGAAVPDGVKGFEERIAVYVKNDSVQKIIIDKLRFAGDELDYFVPPENFIPFGSYAIITKASPSDEILQSELPILQPGQEATIIISLDDKFKVSRSVQIKLTSALNTVVVGTVVMGTEKN